MTAKILTLLGIAIPWLGVARGAEDATKNALATLQGGWKVESLEVDGKSSEILQDLAYWWVIKDDKVFYGGSELATINLDPKTSPKCIDLAFREPKRAFEGIYDIEEDTLKICVNQATDGIKERPTEFSTKGKPGFRLLVLKRDKDRKADSTEGLGAFVGIMIKAEDEGKKLVITGLIAGGPAEKAGLKKDDVLIKVAEQEPASLKSAVDQIRKMKPGNELTLRVKRDGKEQDIAVKAGVMPFYLFD
jgi:uncharacterized protein (TIGR03067 family)